MTAPRITAEPVGCDCYIVRVDGERVGRAFRPAAGMSMVHVELDGIADVIAFGKLAYLAEDLPAYLNAVQVFPDGSKRLMPTPAMQAALRRR